MRTALAYRDLDEVVAHEDEALGRAELARRVTGEEIGVSSCRLDPKGRDIFVDRHGKAHWARIVFYFPEVAQCA